MKQPEALRLAEILESERITEKQELQAAVELRRLHESNITLLEAAENAISQITSHLMLLKCDDEFISSQTQQLSTAIAKATGEQA